ncbi:MAG TPA: plastocyanin/azurin family copper-binding protein [Solirubrobacteraceae bacterium]|jgi:plastocyanin|nr:plastocyanin/azurin family copper-binding protein [Solirubrobacteraceae bacterium]
MRTRLSALVACVAIVALAGCGSSSSGSSSSSAASTSSTAAKTSTSSLKVTTTPKFAPATGAVKSGIVQVAYRNIAIAPDTFKVKVGSTIKWTNFDNVAHNVTSLNGPQKFASKDFDEGGAFEVKALKPGVIHYECTIHPASMNGTIEVVD